MAYETDSDEALIRAYLNGDDQAFEALVLRHQHCVFNLCLRMVGSVADAEDLTQEIFVGLLSKLGGFQGRAKFTTWLYRLSTNKCLDWLRAQRSPMVPLDQVELAEDGAGGGVIQAVLERVTHEQVIAALKRVPVDFRVAVVLRDIEGLAYDEIAGILDVSSGTVKSRISRGRRLVCKLLREDSVQEAGRLGSDEAPAGSWVGTKHPPRQSNLIEGPVHRSVEETDLGRAGMSTSDE